MQRLTTSTSTSQGTLLSVCWLAVAACGGSGEIDDPACWPVSSSTARGSIELGTGIDAYIPMPDELELVYGIQGGFHFEVRARIRGLEPGDPVDVLSWRNPTTRYQAFHNETGEPINPQIVSNTCGAKLGYPQAEDGDGYLLGAAQLRFPDGVTAGIFDQPYRVVVEIIDANGGYATDEKVVIAREPPGWNTQN